MLLECVILVALALYLVYRWMTVNFDFFKKRGIAYDKPYPFLGSMKDFMFRKKSIFDIAVSFYNSHDGKVFGVFDFQTIPVYLIRDPDLLKQIIVKDFDHFINHRRALPDTEGSKFLNNALFFMYDGAWKDMRSTLSPAFTGSKMRQMFELINQVAQDAVEYLKQEPGVNTKDGLDLDVKDYCTRFTNDVIATTAFGLQVNSFKEKENEFFLTGKTITTFTGWQTIKLLFFGSFKHLAMLLKLEIFDQKCVSYFKRLVLDAMKYRKEHNISRPDMINMLMEARGMIKSDKPKTHNREWTDIDIVAQCFAFFFAGFDTASLLLCFGAHELMENPETQRKLLEEIEEVDKELQGKPLTYEALQNMKYMDMVTSEALRKWPPLALIDRVCTKDFIYESDGERVEIKTGENIWLPVAGFHRDPKYFENPNKFDPERFSEENKQNIVPFTYMPFGSGPRNCIGSRFVLMEAKAILYYLVRDFRIEAAEKSCVPLELSGVNIDLSPRNGFWLKFICRNKHN